MIQKINIGSGEVPLPGYLNIDARADLLGVDLACDVRKLDMIGDEMFDEAFAKDVLEHMPRREWRNVLDEWIRILKPGGILKLRFPDSILLFEAYKGGHILLERLFQLVFGDQDCPENAHLSGLTRELVLDYLKEKGLTILKDWRDGHADIRVSASKGELNPELSIDHPDYQFK
jgi:SAM-dependent methyltransferase